MIAAPTADLVDRTFKAYATYSSGFIIVMEDKYPGGTVVSFYNPFDISGSVRKQGEKGKIGNVEYWIEKWTQDTDLDQIYPFTPERIEEHTQLDNIVAIYPMFHFSSHYILFENATHVDQMGTDVLAVDPRIQERAILPFTNMESGRFIAPGENTVVINQILMREEHAEHEFDVGGEMPVVILDEERMYRIVGVIGLGLPYKLMPGLGIVMDIDTLFSELDVEPERRRYNALAIQVDDPDNAQQVIETLRETYEGYNLSYLWQAQQAWASTQLLEATAPLYNIIKNLLIVSTALTITIGSILKINRNRRDIGLLVAIGWREKAIAKHLLVSSVLEGSLGVLLGVGLSILIGDTLATMLIPQSLRNVYMINPNIPDPVYILHTPLLTLGLLAVSLAGTYWYIRRYTPLEMLQET
ncbi:hypothetical protein A3K78_06540 [Candidatus Bathyarchaeota archaeon RBG_13_52_12]|nr:MAG: hypothetical protein A3K78_06540 [Candidatus Bathyarchaeota archaeon RBG_13_52_12]